MMTDDEIIAVVKAHKEGKQIQAAIFGFEHEEASWHDTPNPCWDFRNLYYRVKPESRKPREWVVWVNDLDYLVRGGVHPNEGNWRRTTVREVLDDE